MPLYGKRPGATQNQRHVTVDYLSNLKLLITFRVNRRPRETYCGHTRLCVCLSAAACLHYCTDPGVTWRNGRGCPLVVHCWADLQSVHGLRCYGNTMQNAWHSPAVIRQAHCTPRAARTTHAGEDWHPSPAITSTRLLRAPFHYVYTAGAL